MTLRVNGRQHAPDAAPDMPLLRAPWDLLDRKGAEHRCGIGQRGACTVLVDGAAVRIGGGAVTNRNFDGYRLLRMPDAPTRIDTHIIESGEAMGGVGEPPLPPVAPALVNALFALTGKPVRKLPILS